MKVNYTQLPIFQDFSTCHTDAEKRTFAGTVDKLETVYKNVGFFMDKFYPPTTPPTMSSQSSQRSTGTALSELSQSVGIDECVRKGSSKNSATHKELKISQVFPSSRKDKRTEEKINNKGDIDMKDFKLNRTQLWNDILRDLSNCLEELTFLQSQEVGKEIIMSVAKNNFKALIDKSQYIIHINTDYFTGLIEYFKSDVDPKKEIPIKRKSITSYSDDEIGTLSEFFAIREKKDMFKVLASAKSSTFDVFSLDDLSSNKPLTTLAFHIFGQFNIMSKFKITDRVMITTLMKLERACTSVPYHNAVHATDVLATTYYILSCPSLMNAFTALEIFALLTACIVHDIDHEGLTNNYLIKTNPDLATLYDKSIVEHHTAKLAFKIMSEESPNIMSNLNQRETRDFKTIVTHLVLATNAKFHLQHFLELQAMLELKKDVSQLNNAERLILLKIILYSADNSNPTKPLIQYKSWVDRIMSEFFQQGDLERGKNLKISPLCDRFNTDIAKSQINFIHYIVAPMWINLAEFVGKGLEHFLERLQENENYYANNPHQFNEFK